MDERIDKLIEIVELIFLGDPDIPYEYRKIIKKKLNELKGGKPDGSGKNL